MKQVLYATIMGTMLFVSVNGFAEKVYTENEIKYCGWSLTCTSDDVPLTGLVKRYYENGNLEREITYKNGKKNGFSKLYDDDGVLKSMGIFQAGIAEGVYVEYGENGVLAKEINFQKGEPVLGYIYDIYGNKTPMSQDELANVKITD